MKKYKQTPEYYADEPIEGYYSTPGRSKEFYLKEEAGDIHIFTGWRYKQGDFSGEGDVIIFNKEDVVKKTIEFIREIGEIPLGSTAKSNLPDQESLEAFLRSFSVSDRLSSYFPVALESIGAIEIFKKEGALYAKPADELPDDENIDEN